MIYQWADSAHNAGDATVVFDALQRVRDEAAGKLYAQDVVVAARDEHSPLHRHFEWRDHVAAKEWRIQQARALIRAVAVVYEEKPDTVVRAFVTVADEQGKAYYTTTQLALSEPTTRAQVIAKALHELESWKRRYREYAELAEIFACVEHVAASVQEPKQSVAA